MVVLSVTHLSKSFAGKPVLRDIHFTLQQGDRMGLVGVNGCGKSTLLKIIAGRMDASEGGCALAKGTRIGFLEQSWRPETGITVKEVLENVFAPQQRQEERLRELEGLMAASPEESLGSVYDEYVRLQSRFENQQGYMWRSLVQGALTGMGFPRDQWDQEAALLSGGELTRLCLARLLLEQPDVLLLDEPTNHLDLNALAWLETYLEHYSGAVIAVSHDRYFLDRVCTCVQEIIAGVTEMYTGNYSRYTQERAERYESRRKAYELQQAEIERQEKVIARLRSFNREKSIKRAESRQKMLDKIERLERPQEDQEMHFSFSVRQATGKDVLDVKNFSKSFGDKPVFRNVSFSLRQGDRVALIGPNGVGKSTLFKCLTGHLKPDGGVARWGANVDLGYYDQLQEELHQDKTILREVWDRFVNMSQTQIRGALGLFLFTGEEVFQPISSLSGGERGRVLLTELMLRKDNVLLLDEPTNHLDADCREVLEAALEDFPGTILAISHDRYFIDRFADSLLIMSEDGMQRFEGDYSAYAASLQREETPADREDGPTRTALGKEKRKLRQNAQRLKDLKAAVREAEDLVSRLEEQVAGEEARLAGPGVWGKEAAQGYQRLRDELARAYESWERAENELLEAENEADH